MQAEVEKARNLMRTELEWMRRMPKARGTKAKYRIDSFYDLKEEASVNLNKEELELQIKSSRLGKKVVDLYNISKSFDQLKIVSDFSYKFSRFEKVGIIGDNGTGKSTFLNLITGQLKTDSGKIEVGETVKFGYYRQDGIQFKPDEKVIDVVREVAEVMNMGDGNKLTATQLLSHFLFPYETQHNKVEKLSGGEKRRLYLCTVLMQNPNFLILDEPTNDLDIMTLNVLEEYLQSFSGCVLIVSHDRYFMDKIVDHVFSFEKDGYIKDFPGNYSIYRDYKDEKDKTERQAMQAERKDLPAKEKPKNLNPVRKLSFKEKREMEQIENEMELLHTERDELESLMNSGSLHHEAMQQKATRYQEVKNLLDEMEMRWLELSEIEG
jgi:ABC transport system ATP-binding/permease protein